MTTNFRSIVLASTSPYRRALLAQLGVDFTVVAPDYDEVIEQNIAPQLLVKHLALHKALSVRGDFPDAVIIGSDQVFVDGRGMIMGKPGSAAAARRQLQAMAGHSHTFYTGLAVVDDRSDMALCDYVTFEVTLRQLTAQQIACYVEREQPLGCAGSFKIEALGIALMEKMSGDDYTSLIGLPLIRLTEMLEQCGIDVLTAALP